MMSLPDLTVSQSSAMCARGSVLGFRPGFSASALHPAEAAASSTASAVELRPLIPIAALAGGEGRSPEPFCESGSYLAAGRRRSGTAGAAGDAERPRGVPVAAPARTIFSPTAWPSTMIGASG